MKQRLLSAAGAVLLSAAGLVAVGAGTARAEDRKYVVCASGACLYVLELVSDRDGDGVTDVDEELLGSDPDDPASTPPTLKLLDTLLNRKLPSFERHFTELVLLPTLMPDGTTIRTGLGEFNLRDGDADLLKSIGIVINEITDRNGFEAAFGLKLSGLKAGVDKETPPKFPFDQPQIIRHLDPALYSAGGSTTVVSGSMNDGKTATGETMGSAGKPFITYGSSGIITKSYEVNYTDGSKDKVVQTYSKDTDGTVRTEKSVESYDADGERMGAVTARGSQWTDSDGTKHTTVEYSKPLKNEDGKMVGVQDVKIHMTENKDGSTTIKTTTTTTKDDGTTTEDVKEEKIEKPEKAEKEKQKEEKEKKDGDYVDPDYIGFDIVTPEDWARVEFRIKQIGMPNQGDGGGPLPEQPPNVDQCTKCGADGTMILMDPDGVVVVAAGEEPNFTKVLQPDYDEWVQVMSGIAGQPVPVTNGTTGGGDTGGPRGGGNGGLPTDLPTDN